MASEEFAFQTWDKAMDMHIIFLSFSITVLTGQENDSTKSEVKIETESPSSSMETEGTEARIY